MKHLYLLLLSALVLLGVNSATADPVTVSWDVEGSVELHAKLPNAWGYDAATNVTALSGTEFLAEGTKDFYFYPTEGYFIAGFEMDKPDGSPLPMKGQDTEGKTYVKVRGNYSGSAVKLIVVRTEDLKDDSSITIDIENGGSFISDIYTDGTATKVELKDGVQTLSYSKYKDSKLYVVPDSKYPIFSIKQNDKVVTKYGWDTYFTIKISDGDQISIRVFENDEDVPKVESSNYNIAISYDDNAKAAMKMIFNQTKLMSIFSGSGELPTEIKVEKGDKVKFTYDSKEYSMDLLYNGEAPDEEYIYVNQIEGITTFTTPAASADATVSFTATEKEWGNTTLTLALKNEDGLILRAGAIDGSEISLADYTPTVSGGYNMYKIPVSLKSPKIFVEAKEGWFTPESYYMDGADKIESSVASDTESFKTGILYVTAHKIEKTAKTIIFYAGDDTAAKARVRIGRKAVLSSDAPMIDTEELSLAAGYNEIFTDPVYTNCMCIQLLEGSTISLYSDGSLVSYDSESRMYDNLTMPGGSLYHLFVGVETPVKHQLSMSIADKTTKVVYDKVKTFTNSDTALGMFEGTEVAITPREGCELTIDGEKKTLTDGTYVLTVSKAHKVSVVYAGNANIATLSPADGESVESLEEITISFPNAKKAVRNEEMGDDEVIIVSTDENWAPIPGSYSIEAAEGDVPVFKIKFQAGLAPTANKNYKLFIPAGFFTVDDDLLSKDIQAVVTLNKVLSEITYKVMPDGPMGLDEWTAPYAQFEFDESVSNITKAIDFAEKATITLNGKVLTYNSSDWSEKEGEYVAMGYDNIFGINASAYYANTTGIFEVKLAEGALLIDGKPSPAIEHTFEFTEPKTYTFSFNSDENFTLRSLNELYITIPEADRVEIGEQDQYMKKAHLYKLDASGYKDYDYHFTGTIAEHTGEATYGTRAEAPKTFKITFDPKPTESGKYELELSYGAFIHDGIPSQPYNQVFTLDIPSGISEIESDIMEGAAVYSIDGRLILKSATKAQSESLQKGIYIVNGKKVLKK